MVCTHGIYCYKKEPAIWYCGWALRALVAEWNKSDKDRFCMVSFVESEKAKLNRDRIHGLDLEDK